MDIPYGVEPRPSTGLTNAKLGMMLFLASEVMLFGAMMTSYVFLRASYTGWAGGEGTVDVGRAILGTLVMAGSSVAIVLARAAHRRGNVSRCRAMLGATLLLGSGFIAITAMAYAEAFGKGIFPSTSTFAAIFFVLTGLHAVHVAGGLIAAGLLLGPWGRTQAADPARFANRIDVAGLYWHFLTAVWLVTFTVLYLA
jgi:heme/copper-type cytochrome/quinol oxidase subunit 3